MNFLSHQYLSPSCHCQPLSSARSKMQDPSSGQKCLIKPCTGHAAASHKAQMVCPTICFRTSCDKRQPTIQHLAHIYLLHCTFLLQPFEWQAMEFPATNFAEPYWCIPLVSSTDKENTIVIPHLTCSMSIFSRCEFPTLHLSIMCHNQGAPSWHGVHHLQLSCL